MTDHLAEFSTRLNEALTNKGLPVRGRATELAKFFKITPKAASKWLNSEAMPDTKKIIDLAEWLDVSVEWLLTGKEKTSSFPTQGSIKISPMGFRTAEDKKFSIRIPVYRHVKASCGDGIENFLEDPSGYLDMDPELLRYLGIVAKPENLRVIYSDEYSMWPTVAPDSPLFIDVGDKDPDFLKNGSVYVFTHNHELRMKRIFVSYAGGKTVRLASDNPDKIRYPDEFITNEQLNEINFVGRLESALVKP